MIKRKQRVVLSGYYGFDNCGDEAVLLAIIESLRRLKPDLEIVVLSGNPDKTAQDYKVKAIPRLKLFNIARGMLGADLVISGGGSLLQDVTSAKSPLYYLGVLALAQRLAKKTMVYAQGIGPLTMENNRKRTVKVFSKCNAITVRDQHSADDLAEMGFGHSVTVVADPVMGLGPEDISTEPGCGILQGIGIVDNQGKKDRPLLVVTLRMWQEQHYYSKVAKVLDNMVATGWDVLMVPMHFPQDIQAVHHVTREMRQRFYCLGEMLGPKELMSIIKNADLVLSMRLHGLIMAMAAEVPMVALSYDPKVDRFMEQTGMNSCLPLEKFAVEELQRIIDRLIMERDQLKQRQKAQRKQLQEKAWVAAHLAKQLLDT